MSEGKRERERARDMETERDIDREKVLLRKLYSPTSFKSSSIKELHLNNGIDVVDKNKPDRRKMPTVTYFGAR